MADYSSDEDEMLENLKYLQYLDPIIRRCRNIGNLSDRSHFNDLESIEESDFISRYRLQKDNVRTLLDRIGHKLQPLTSRKGVITPLEQILVALRFYATGTFQIVVGNLTNLSQPSCCRAVNKVSFLIAQLSQEFIHLPRNEVERKQISQEFYNMSGFPGVYGAIDCTHVRIQSPGGDNAEVFRNRKGYFSLNVQTVSDVNLSIRNIVARRPGSAHDSTIFAHSHLCAMLKHGEIPSYYHLLGDSGYGCKAYLMTPILNPQTNAELRYNRSHIRTRNTVERQYGLWKRRFPYLSLGLRCNLKNAMNIIVATAVLHNMEILKGNTALVEDSLTTPTNSEIHDDVPVETSTERNIQGFAKEIQ